MLDTNFNEIINLIEKRKHNAYKKVNEELISLYLEVGEFLYNMTQNSKYGDKVLTSASNFMKSNYPNIRGFTKRNMERMVQLYSTYKDDEIATTLLTQLSWSNNLLILSSSKSKEEREFYLKMAIKENYSYRELNRQLSSGYYERYMLSDKKTKSSILPTIDEEDFPNLKILDTYSLEFLDLPNEYSEKDLKNSIIKNMKNFILEIGKGFTFVGEEYRVQVSNTDYYIDLLFYNRDLSCLVAFELKIGKFIPEYISKMDFYLEALDRQEKKQKENPSIGVILCATKDDQTVEYSMSRSLSPTMVAEYKLKLIDKEILQNKLKEITELLENNE